MENFTIAVAVVLPLLIYMTVGKLVEKLHILSQDNFKAMNGMIFRIFIPLNLFFSVYQSNLRESIKPKIFLFVLLGVLIAFFITWIIITKLVKENGDATTLIQGIYRSNYVLFGNSIAMSLGGESSLALVSALAAMAVPLFNILAVILFEVKRGGNIKVAQIILNIFKNPLVDAGILGCLLNLLYIPIPKLVMEPLVDLANIATPLALVTLGGMLSFSSIASHKKYLTWAVAGRLILIPIIILPIAVCFGMRGDELIAILAVFASPTAVASAPMAQSMGGNGSLAGEIVALTSACCIITLFLFVLTLLKFGLI